MIEKELFSASIVKHKTNPILKMRFDREHEIKVKDYWRLNGLTYDSEYNDSPNTCSVVATAVAVDISFEEAYERLAEVGKRRKVLMSYYKNIEEVLKDYGFVYIKPKAVYDTNDKIEFLINHKVEDPVVIGIHGHVFTVKDGYIYDKWYKPLGKDLKTSPEQFGRKFMFNFINPANRTMLYMFQRSPKYLEGE